MKILIASHAESTNLVVRNTMKGIAMVQGAEVVSSTENFWYSNLHFDIVHIQWIEELLSWKPVTEADITRLVKKLREWKKRKAKLICTYHNEYPHRNQEIDKKLYHAVLKELDGIIHLGEYSVGLIRSKYQDLPHLVHKVIYHPLYEDETQGIGKGESRKILGVPEGTFLFFVGGTIRHKKEMRMVTKAFYAAKIKRKKMIIARYVQPTLRKPIARIFWEFKRWSFKVFKQMDLLTAGVLPNRDFSLYFKAADAVVIPRVNTLNSGIVYAGLSTGNLLIGPNVGNIKEILGKTGNISFNVRQERGLAQAMELAEKTLKEQGIPDYFNFIKDNCLIAVVGRRHVDFYNELLDMKRIVQ